tara:strand:+ start:2386 stop:3177 length:792 start_codon:yes stop_codon:yes gene_type:complete
MSKKKYGNKTKLSIVIPVLNEGKNLKILLKLLKSMIDVPHEVLVVHDIIEDNSIPVVESLQKNYNGLRLVHNKTGKGVIYAIKSGVSEAKGDYVLIIAADDIGPVLIIKDMLTLMDRGCELVNATRYAYGGRNIGGVFLSRMLSVTANKILYKLSNFSLTDSTLGVKMFKRDKFNQIKLESLPIGWAVSFEFAIKAQLAGWKIGEVPMVSLNRIQGGKSSFRARKWVREYLKWFFWGISKNNIPNKSKVLIKIPGKKKISTIN